MKKTKLLLCSLVGLLAFGMVSCGDDSSGNNNNPGPDIEDHEKPDDNKDPNDNEQENEKVDYEKECLEIEKTKFVDFKKFEVSNGVINYELSFNDPKIDKNQTVIHLMNSRGEFGVLENLSGSVDNLDPNMSYWISVTLRFDLEQLSYKKEETSNSIYYSSEDNNAKVEFKTDLFSAEFKFDLDIFYLRYLKVDKVTLFKGEEKLKELEATKQGIITDLDEDTEYKVVFDYTYNASGLNTNEKGCYEATFKTLALDGLAPTLKLQNFNTFDKMLYHVEENSKNHSVTVKNVNLLDNENKKIETKTESQGIFENLVPGKTYYVELEYDLNDGHSTKTLKLKEKFENIEYDYVNKPVLSFETSKTVHEITYNVKKIEESVVIQKVELVKNANVIQVKDTLQGTFDSLDANQNYTLRYAYSWVIKSSNTKMEKVEEVEVSTDYDYTCFVQPSLEFEYLDIRKAKFKILLDDSNPDEVIQYNRTEIYQTGKEDFYHHTLYSGTYYYESENLVPNTDYTVQMEYYVLKDGKEYELIKYEHFKTLPYRLPEIKLEILNIADNAVYFNYTCKGITEEEKDKYLSDAYVTKNGIPTHHFDYQKSENLWEISNLEPNTTYELCMDYSYYDPITYKDSIKSFKVEFTTLNKLPEVVCNKTVAYNGKYYYRFTKQTKDYCHMDIKSIGLYDNYDNLVTLNPSLELEGVFDLPKDTEKAYRIILKYDLSCGDNLIHREVQHEVGNDYKPAVKPTVSLSKYQNEIMYMSINFNSVNHLTLYYDSVDIYTNTGEPEYTYLRTQTSGLTQLTGVTPGHNVKLVYHFRYVYDELLKFEDYKFDVTHTTGVW